MTKNVNNVHAYGDITQAIWTSPLGTASPATPTAVYPAGWSELGWVDDGGVTESQTYQETKVYGWQGASLLRVLRSQAEHSFKFNCLEETAAVLGLFRPGTTQTTTGATADVQTITITGSPTGGTFTLNNIGYGAASYTATYNVPTATLAAALSAIVGGTVTVTGTAGTSYVVTFPSTLGNVPAMSAASGLTGGTTPTVAVVNTTPGVNGTTSWPVKPFVSRNLRQFGIDLVDGSVSRRFLAQSAEVTSAGDIVYKADALTVYQFNLNVFVDSSGNFFTELTNNPVVGSGLFT
jgi:hypothetical protein